MHTVARILVIFDPILFLVFNTAWEVVSTTLQCDKTKVSDCLSSGRLAQMKPSILSTRACLISVQCELPERSSLSETILIALHNTIHTTLSQ